MNALTSLKLLLPAIIPSWNFFDIITASPRIEYSLLSNNNEATAHWQEFRPRPKSLSPNNMLKRILWNPQWNESLFLVSCAERIMANLSEDIVLHSENEILTRIEQVLRRNNQIDTSSYLQFRLIYLNRENKNIYRNISFTSRKLAL
ncbi:MAG: hypothetical protein QM484_12025 [Woeseiaceae bacterium]